VLLFDDCVFDFEDGDDFFDVVVELKSNENGRYH